MMNRSHVSQNNNRNSKSSFNLQLLYPWLMIATIVDPMEWDKEKMHLLFIYKENESSGVILSCDYQGLSMA